MAIEARISGMWAHGNPMLSPLSHETLCDLSGMMNRLFQFFDGSRVQMDRLRQDRTRSLRARATSIAASEAGTILIRSLGIGRGPRYGSTSTPRQKATYPLILRAAGLGSG